MVRRVSEGRSLIKGPRFRGLGDRSRQRLENRSRLRSFLSLEQLEPRCLLAGAISGKLFADQNRNGIQDAAEDGMAQIRVVLYDGYRADNEFPETVTDAFGRFRFDNLPMGNYDIAVDLPSGLTLPRGFATQITDTVDGFHNPASIATGFLEGDARPEIFVLQAGSISTSDSVTVLSDVNGSLQRILEIPVLADPQSMAVADLNQDGFSDLAITGGQNGQVQIFINDQLGGFGEPVLIAVESLPRGLAAADLDGDGDLDLAVANSASSTVSILINDGSGAFSVAASMDAGPAPEAISVADLNGDSLNDLVIGNLGSGRSDGGITVLTNTTSSFTSITFQSNHLVIGNGLPIVDVATDRFLDSNGDGKVDQLDTPSIASVAVAEGVYVMDGQTLDLIQFVNLVGSVKPAVRLGATTLTKGDFDHDGDLDLAAASTAGGGVVLIPNQSQTHFTETVRNPPGAEIGYTEKALVASVDVDLDGDLDFVIAGQNFNSQLSPVVPSRDVQLYRSSLGLDLEATKNGYLCSKFGDPCSGGVDVTLTETYPSQSISILVESRSVVVNSTGDGGDADLTDHVATAADGTVTLRAAIEQANASIGHSLVNIIEFDLPGTGTQVIAPGSTLPAITVPMIIDGRPSLTYTGAPRIMLDGHGGRLDVGLTFESGNSTVAGIGLANFRESGVQVTGDLELRLQSDVHDALFVGDGFQFAGTSLENGRLIHAFVQRNKHVVFVGPSNFTNPLNRADVNHDQSVSGTDALVLINELSRRNFSRTDGTTIDPAQVNLRQFKFFDANRDGRVTAIDALFVINQLARQSDASGESWESEMISCNSQVVADNDDGHSSADEALMQLDPRSPIGPLNMDASNEEFIANVLTSSMKLQALPVWDQTASSPARLLDWVLKTLGDETLGDQASGF